MHDATTPLDTLFLNLHPETLAQIVVDLENAIEIYEGDDDNRLTAIRQRYHARAALFDTSSVFEGRRLLAAARITRV